MNFRAYKSSDSDSYGILDETIRVASGKDFQTQAHWKQLKPGQISIEVPGPYSRGEKNFYIIMKGNTMEIGFDDGVPTKMNRI